MRALAGSAAGDALGAAVDALGAAGVDTPRLDAELLLAEATGWPRERLAAAPETELAPAAARRFAELVRRRLGREPVAYILGRKGFRGIELMVDRRVLIPRPETELLVEIGLELAPRRALDVGTGSGAVALALEDELEGLEAWGSDTSLEALAVARENARTLGLGDGMRLVEGTIPSGAPSFDLLLANLPYVAESEWAGLEPEITRFEPRRALVAGPTGLESIESLLGEVSFSPRPPAAIALEVGAGQAPRVAEHLRRAGFERVESRRDLAGIERVVLGR